MLVARILYQQNTVQMENKYTCTDLKHILSQWTWLTSEQRQTGATHQAEATDQKKALIDQTWLGGLSGVV